MSDIAIRDLEEAGRDDLITLWRKLNDGPPPKQMSTPMMRRILAFDLQARDQGGFAKNFVTRLRRQATSRNRRTPSRQDGSRFMRVWNGRTHTVDLIDGRYHWNGKTYRSLSAIAREITGAHWSGPRFFGTAKAG